MKSKRDGEGGEENENDATMHKLRDVINGEHCADTDKAVPVVLKVRIAFPVVAVALIATKADKDIRGQDKGEEGRRQMRVRRKREPDRTPDRTRGHRRSHLQIPSSRSASRSFVLSYRLLFFSPFTV